MVRADHVSNKWISQVRQARREVLRYYHNMVSTRQPASWTVTRYGLWIFNIKIRFMLLSGDSSSHSHGTGMQISGTCSEHAHAGLVAAEAQWTQYQPSCSYHGEYGRSRMTGSWITGWGKHRPSSRGNLGGRSAPDPDRGKAHGQLWLAYTSRSS